MRVVANSKVNLFLRVIDKREDGYHDIETIFHTVGFGDEIAIGPGPGIEVSIRDGAGSEIELEDELVTAAAHALAKRAGRPAAAHITIQKRVPIGGGLAGGSADAAAALVALNEAWDVGLHEDALVELASTVGSDVPFCIIGGTAVGRGKGEILERVEATPELWFALAFDRHPMSTHEVYEAWTESSAPPGSAEEMVSALAEGDLSRIATALHNDLQPVTVRLRPELRDGLTLLEDAGALAALVSGSGPTLFGLCRDGSSARRVADRVAERFAGVAVASSASASVQRLD
jgi:4-diphosphocytidyl-2-C-methyl-D-erythritol kinase